ncbi:hypothetical protein C5C31_10800 [Rathayibacter rathayi]|uniref:Ku protein n=1 Tax=Rathayibacter rathayi TaxID=33887 RepID=UPI000CE8B057|nr:hypothetical protein C5C31_10800 [Rathayibacter rathayi]
MRAIDGRIRYQRKCEIDVVQFVPSEQVDPIMFDRAYILEPDSSSPKAYVLLRRTLEQTDRTAIVEFALRQKTRLAALRVRGTLLMLQTLLWADEVREVEFSSLEEGSGGEVLGLMEALRRSVERSRGPKGAGAGAAESPPKKADPEKADPEKASASSPTKAAAKKPPPHGGAREGSREEEGGREGRHGRERRRTREEEADEEACNGRESRLLDQPRSPRVPLARRARPPGTAHPPCLRRARCPRGRPRRRGRPRPS